MRQFKVSSIWPHNRLISRTSEVKGIGEYTTNPLSTDERRNEFFFGAVAPDFDSDSETGRETKFTSKYDRKPTRRQFIITMYGTFADGSTVAINVTGFRPYFHVMIPKGINPEHFRNELVRYIFTPGLIVPKHRVIPDGTDIRMTAEIKQFIPANGFCNNTFHDFIEFRFSSSNTKNRYLKLIKRVILIRDGSDFVFDHKENYKDVGNLQVYTEADTENYHFFIDANVKGADGKWMRPLRSCGPHYIDKSILYEAQPHTIQQYEYYVDYEDFRTLNMRPQEYGSFIQKHIVFDIETVPAVSLVKGQREAFMMKYGASLQAEWETFPEDDRKKMPYEAFLRMRVDDMVKKHLPSDYRPKPNLRAGDIIYSVAISIASVPENDWSKAKWVNKVLCIHPAKDAVDAYNKTVPAGEERFRCYETGNEAKLICAMLEIIRRENPEYIHGYNSFKYDWDWIHERAKDQNYLRDGNLRIKGKDMMVMFDHINKEHNRFNVWKIETKTTTALGKTNYHYPITTGINNIDVLKYFFDLNDSRHKGFKLFEIAATYLPESKRKKEFSFETMNKTYFEIERGVLTGEAAQKAVFDVLYYNLFDCISVHWLLSICNIVRSFESGAELVIHSVQEYFCRRNTTKVVAGLSEIASQEKKVLIKTGKEEEDVDHIAELLEQMPHRRAEYEMLKKAAENDPKKRKKLATYEEKLMDEHIVVGGMVQCHVPGFHRQTCTLDVKSMYPSNILAFNISPDTIVDMEGEYFNVDGVRYIYINWKYKDYKETGIKNTTTFVCDFEGGDPKYTGILPKFIRKLLDDRKRINAEMAAFIKSEVAAGVPKAVAEKSGRYQSLNSQQLEVKKLTNSCYGVTLASTFPFYNPNIGGCIPSKGREYIEMVTAIVESVFGGKVVYGDTDSVFNEFANIFNPNADYLTNSYTIWDYNEKVVKFINDLCMKRGARSVVLELEKIFADLYISGKKRYCGHLYENRNPKALKQKIAGYGVKKRDASPFEDIAGKDIVNILSGDRANELGKYIDDLIKSTYVPGKYYAEDFRRTLGWMGEDGYKNPSRMAQTKLVAIIKNHDPGAVVMPGDRIEYVYLRYVNGVDMRDQFTSNGTIKGVRGYKTADKMWPLSLYDPSTMDIDVYENFKRVVSSFADAFDEIVQRDGVTLKPNKDTGVVVPGDPINKGIRLGWLLRKFRAIDAEVQAGLNLGPDDDPMEKYRKMI